MIKERQTKQKTLILSAVQSVTSHPTAEQVHAMLAADLPGLSLGTVYRNLNHMAEIGILRRISVINSPDRFDGDLTPHHHLCCNGCGTFGDFFASGYDESLDRLTEKKSGYLITRHETVYYGLCPKCKSKK